ncbi:hypothetical protein [Actinospica robiniae]|uniref:hypothetical protein n=1 Tax=Actinospica robiniae TaxID=304901 RepID=UPI00041F6087|nr:hypothetical protein [Actinospica robiniae]
MPDANSDTETTDEATLPIEESAPSWAARHSGLRRRGLTHWLAASLGFGLVAGPVIGLAVNHGHPQPVVVTIVLAPLMVLAALFVLVGVHYIHWTWRHALWRVLLVLLAGSVVFLLPNSLNLPATGDFWWATVLEKYAISCLPYPLVGWLVMPGIRRRLAVEVCVLVAAALALTWPALLRGMRAQTADVLRHEINVPPSMLYVLEMPGAKTVAGYFHQNPAAWLGYRLPASAHQAATDGPDLGYDVTITVFPATKSSPCSQLPDILEKVDDFDRRGMSCGQTAPGHWEAADDGTFETLDDATEVEVVGGDYVALTIAQKSRAFDDEFAVLFADLRHPTSAQLVQIGLAGGPNALF